MNNGRFWGSLIFLLFCTRRYGWGWNTFYKETSVGKGLPYPAGYCTCHFRKRVFIIVKIGGYYVPFI